MNLGYKSARKIIVVLEDIILNAEERRMLYHMIEKQDSDWAMYEKNIPLLSSILIRIHSARWFTGVLCSHKLQLGTGGTQSGVRNPIFLLLFRSTMHVLKGI